MALRRVENVVVARHRRGFIWRRYWWTVSARRHLVNSIDEKSFNEMVAASLAYPVAFGGVGERTYWLFKDRWFTENDGLDADQVHALLVTRDQREARRIARAQAIVAMQAEPAPARRGAIPDDVKQLVWTRDGGRCARCRSNAELQYDHIIPLALGGSSTAENLQILCGPCNRRKGAALT
jgi:5-methylcytosine-specific restriction endonuclease McrA